MKYMRIKKGVYMSGYILPSYAHPLQYFDVLDYQQLSITHVVNPSDPKVNKNLLRMSNENVTFSC